MKVRCAVDTLARVWEIHRIPPRSGERGYSGLTRTETGMSSQETTKPSDSQPPAVPSTSLANGLAAKVFVSIGIVCVTGWILGVYSELLRGPGLASSQAVVETDPVVELLALPVTDGAWQIQGLDWDLAVSQASEAQFPTRWATAPLPTTDIKSRVDLPFEMLVRVWKPVVRRLAGGKVYEFVRPTSRIQLWTLDQNGTELLHTIRAGVLDGKVWQLYELRPQSPSPETTTGPHIENWPVPPPKVNRVCRRYDQERRILAELWAFDIPLSELVLNWEKSGWRPARPLSNLIPSPDTPSKTPLLNFTLENNSQQILVRLVRSSPGEPSLVILTRANEKISPPKKLP
ncbi:MAG: hypothetical protein JWN70_4857 [Planctomycetaceae bacterium]|nr:hypothetical protein [Planctomycetaceae bacterium]